MQIELIKWLAYPENIPNRDRKHYIVTIKHPDKGYTTMELFWVGNEFKDFDDWVTAYAHRPKPCDPTAKQFNFWTALEMMKNGVLCRSMVSGKHIRIPNNYNGFIEDDGEFNSDHYIVLAEIEGLWERADAD